MRLLRTLVTLVLLLSAVPSEAERLELFGGFADGWQEEWRERGPLLPEKRTIYTVEEDESGRLVLRGESHAANLGLIREISGGTPDYAILSWRWKIDDPLVENRRERKRSGDDYAARVFVVFERGTIPSRTRAITYVWAANEPVGSIFPSPYASRVGTVVLRSSADAAYGWRREERDLLDDYRRYFGRDPEELSAVAIMVDTDDTGLDATAWFADLQLETTKP